MGATQTRESRQLGREYAQRVTAQQYADIGDLNHATSHENKASKYGYKADRTHARRFNRGKTPFPLAQHGIPATALAQGGAQSQTLSSAPTQTMPLGSDFIAAPTVPTMQQDWQPMQQSYLAQETFVPVQNMGTAYQAPMTNYQGMDNFATPVETIVMPPTVLPPIIAPAANYW